MPSDESMKKEDEDETNIDNYWIASRMHEKNKPGNKHISDEFNYYKNKYEVLESDSDNYEENEKKYWEGDFFRIGECKSD